MLNKCSEAKGVQIIKNDYIYRMNQTILCPFPEILWEKSFLDWTSKWQYNPKISPPAFVPTLFSLVVIGGHSSGRELLEKACEKHTWSCEEIWVS